MRTGLAILMCLTMWVMMQTANVSREETGGEIFAEKDGYRACAALDGEKTEKVRLKNLPPENDFLFLVNEKNTISEVKEMTTSVRSMVGSFLPLEGDFALRPEVIYALCEMAVDYPLHEGMTFIRGYVSADEQNAWQREAVERYKKVGKTEKEALSLVPCGGCSDHQTGLSVDIRLEGKLSLGKKDWLQRSETGRWLAENMWKYGFVYEKNAVCEEIHIRYVGKSHAQMMHVLGMELEAYLAFLETKKAAVLYSGDRVILYVKWLEKDETLVSVPEAMPVTLSQDNRGNTILCATAE